MYISIRKYIVEIHTSNIIIEKNHKANINSTGFIFQSSGVWQWIAKCKLAIHCQTPEDWKMKPIEFISALWFFLVYQYIYMLFISDTHRSSTWHYMAFTTKWLAFGQSDIASEVKRIWLLNTCSGKMACWFLQKRIFTHQ